MCSCRFCGYIVDNGDSQFMCHGFKAEPNTNKMCIALHGACQVSYVDALKTNHLYIHAIITLSFEFHLLRAFACVPICSFT